MKKYLILIILASLLSISTSCEDVKASSKDYDDEIAELKNQINALNEKIDAMPKVNVYETTVQSDGMVSVNIPEIKLNDLPTIVAYREVFSSPGVSTGEYRLFSNYYVEDGRIFRDSNGGDPGGKVIFIVTK